MFKLIFEIVAANLISDAIRAPTRQQVEAERYREWLLTREQILRTKSNAIIADLVRGKDYTPEQIISLHKTADEELNKVLMADYQSVVEQKKEEPSGGKMFAIGLVAVVVIFLVWATH